jgi:hypothetical protein
VAGLENLNLIILSDPAPTLREAVQELVVQHASEWWHQLPDVWIVQGDDPKAWRDRLAPLKTAAGDGSSLLVLSLPDSYRAWAFRGPNNKLVTEWLYENYTGGTAS